MDKKSKRYLVEKCNMLIDVAEKLKAENAALDLEIKNLTEKKAVLQNRINENEKMAALDQERDKYRPDSSFYQKGNFEQEIGTVIEDDQNSCVGNASMPENPELERNPVNEELNPVNTERFEMDTQTNIPVLDDREEAPLTEQMDPVLIPTDLQMMEPGINNRPMMPEKAPVTISQDKIIEMIKLISLRMDQMPKEEIIVRNVSAGAKMLEIFHDVTGKIFKVIIMGIFMLLISLAVTVLINAELRNMLLEFLKKIGV